MQSVVLLLSLVLLAAPRTTLAQDETPAETAPAPDAVVADAAEVAEAPPASVDTKDACGRCPNVSTQHYQAKSCTPVMDLEVDPCCPVRWDCSTEEARSISMTSCLYQNKTYEVDEAVPVVGPCRRCCTCKRSLVVEEPAKIECAIVECPSVYSGPKPGCRPLYSNDECCEVDLECNTVVPETEVLTENVTIRSSECFAEGLEYFYGDKVFFSMSPCQQCICTDQFAGAYGPNCTTIDCGMEYRDRQFLRDGCTPLYQNGICCPTDWICPDSPAIIFDESRVAKGDDDPKTTCKLGESVVAAKGEALHTYDCHVSCQCITPPDFTCVKYSSCPIAVAAQNSRDAP